MADRQEPIRMCVVCRRRLAKSQLLRHVSASENSANGLEPDERQTSPGRGWYVCSDPLCRSRFASMKFRRKSHKGRTNG
ncbi:MAG: YlxR family protein [Mailhella sp.]